MSDTDIIYSDNAEYKIEKRRGSVTPVKLTPAQEAKFSEVKAILLWQQPFFASLLYTQLREVYTSDVPIAATDGDTLFFNPETFCKYTSDEGVFIFAHEIMHCVLDHCTEGYKLRLTGKVPYADGTKLEYDASLMNIAQDLVINDMLITANVGKFNTDWLHDKAITGQMSSLDAYRSRYKKPPKTPPGGGKPCPQGNPGPGGNSGGNPGHAPPTPGQLSKPHQKGQAGQYAFDQHLSPGAGKGTDPGKAAGERDDTGWELAVQSAAQAARLQGKLPASLDKLIGDMLEPEVDWREHIRGAMARALGGGGWDWLRADRRLMQRKPNAIFAPSRSGYGCGTVVIGVDTSGSIYGDPGALETFFGCMAGILGECKPRRLVVIWCDAEVKGVDEVEDAGDLMDLKARGAKGGGGTRFEPVFEEIEKLGIDPDALVYLTDLYGSFPEKPPAYPTIWARLPRSSTAPWGEVIDIPDLKG